MLNIEFKFNERNDDLPPGFDLGDMSIFGNCDSVASANSNQSMMLILSIVELLDGLRRFLSLTESRCYEFIGVDCSFSLVFCRELNGDISISWKGKRIHAGRPPSIKSDVQNSVLRFSYENDLAKYMNSAEAADFRASLADFQEFTPL